ncbi:MAG: LysR family transcriptional regulator [Ruminococcaceae bacterium]|nr:LysR family transcriptional regulator [Oscillospiraceae bacterium]
MDIQNIKTFLYIAKLENFSKAADELNYAQSTVTSQMQQLEKELGFPLFERIGRRNYLTQGGKEFLNYAKEILHLVEQAGTIGENLKQTKGILRIGVLESLLFAKLLPLLPVFQQMYPHLELVIKIGQSTELISLLKQNQLDIIYISNAMNTDSAVKCCYQHRESLVFVSSSHHPLCNQKSVSVQDIFQHPFVVTEPTGYCFSRLREITSEHNLSLQYGITVDNITAIISLLQDNKSVAFLPEYALKEPLQYQTLKKLNVSLPNQVYYSQLLCAKEKWLSPFIESLIQVICQQYPV